MGVATTLAPNCLGPPSPTKTLAHWVDLLANRYLEIMFSKFSGVNPTSLKYYVTIVYIINMNNC